MTNTQLELIVRGIMIKLSRGENIDTILSTYTKLSDAEKKWVKNRIAELQGVR